MKSSKTSILWRHAVGLILLLSLHINCGMAYAQSLSERGFSPQTGSFVIDGTPVKLNLPEGFMYLDAQTTKEILSYHGNESSTTGDVVGMILPKNMPSPELLSRAWVLSYRDIGHVQDKNASKLGFTWILNELRNSDAFQNKKLLWTWDPEYDVKHHRLSLPLLCISGSDSILNHRQFIFGNTGLILVDPIASISDAQWLYDHDKPINNAIGFTEGNRYEDFDGTTQPNAYQSVTAFLNGLRVESTKPANEAPKMTEDVSSEAAADSTSSSPSFISLIGIVAGSLVAIMLMLMLGVAVTAKKNETGKDIVQSGINVLLRIGVFCMVYLLILTFGIFLIWLGIRLSIGILRTGYISLLLIIAIISGWSMIGGFLWAIIRSLFVFSRPEYTDRFEIFRSDAPALFALIEEISRDAREKMPKHVYVASEANAYVAYDKPFLSLFVPGRKNLTVGLGLLFGLNRQEFKAVIAHEYGHFGQGSMRIGQITSICYDIISNLVNSEKTSVFRPILNKTFTYVQRGYLSLAPWNMRLTGKAQLSPVRRPASQLYASLRSSQNA